MVDEAATNTNGQVSVSVVGSGAANAFYASRVTKQKSILDYNPSLKLDELDRQIIDQILAPLLDLRLTCEHPQLILRKSDFMHQSKENKDKLLTMERSLELLMKKTKSESENIYRSVITNSVALAGLKILQKKYDEAIQLYQSNLDSKKDLESHGIKFNTLQSIHIYHNYLDAITLSSQSKTDLNNNKSSMDDRIVALRRNLAACEREHLSPFDEEKLTSEQKLKERLEENKFFSHGKHYIAKRVEALGEAFNQIKAAGDKSDEFWKKITHKFGTNKADDYLNQYVVENVVYGKVVKDLDDLKSILVDEYEKLLVKRECAVDKSLMLFDKKTKIQTKCKKFSFFLLEYIILDTVQNSGLSAFF